MSVRTAKTTVLLVWLCLCAVVVLQGAKIKTRAESDPKFNFGDVKTWAILAGIFIGFLILAAVCYFLPQGQHASPHPALRPIKRLRESSMHGCVPPPRIRRPAAKRAMVRQHWARGVNCWRQASQALRQAVPWEILILAFRTTGPSAPKTRKGALQGAPFRIPLFPE